MIENEIYIDNEEKEIFLPQEESSPSVFIKPKILGVDKEIFDATVSAFEKSLAADIPSYKDIEHFWSKK